MTDAYSSASRGDVLGDAIDNAAFGRIESGIL